MTSLRWSTSLDDLRVERAPMSRGPIEYARVGSGPAVLVIHGLPGSWRQAVPLGEDLPGFDIVFPSRPGYGRTPIRVARTCEEQADSYVALLDALGIARAAIVGISGGGPSAVAFAARHPDRCSALLLACALSNHLMTTPPNLRWLMLPGLYEVLGPPVRALERRKMRKPGAIEAWMSEGLTSDELARAEADPRIREDLIRFLLSHDEAPLGLAGQRNDYAQIAAVTSAPTKLDVSSPTLVMHGDADVVVPVEHARYHASAIPGAELELYENAGHVFLFTRRRETSQEIRDFLTAHAV